MITLQIHCAGCHLSHNTNYKDFMFKLFFTGETIGTRSKDITIEKNIQKPATEEKPITTYYPEHLRIVSQKLGLGGLFNLRIRGIFERSDIHREKIKQFQSQKRKGMYSNRNKTRQ